MECAAINGFIMKRKKIMIITDSIAMPRPDIRYEDTWIYLLKKEFPHYDFIDRPVRGSTSTRLVPQCGGLDLLESYMPDVIILQQGMAECAPRLFHKQSLEFYIVSRILPIRIRQWYIDYVKKHRGRNPHITDVEPEQFQSNISGFIKRARNISARVIIIPILPPAEILIRKSPHILININRYNAIYHEAARVFPNVLIVDPFRGEIDINDIALDEIHIKPKGLKMIFNALKPLL
jgi:acyl-CoA thioesterase I